MSARAAAGARTPRTAPLRAMLRAGLGAVLPLLMPGMLLAGILSGIATPTEVAAFAVLYGAVLADLRLSRDGSARVFFAP